MNNDTNNQSSNNDSTYSSNSKSSKNNNNNDNCCVNPLDIFTIAGAISLLLYKELNICQLRTVLNLSVLIVSNLEAFVSQIDINKGNIVQPPFIEPL